ncbi:MAG: rhomboid family intramembrane serine protease [Cytophagaceae bacterium]
MDEILKKIRYIYLRYLIISLGIISIYSISRWYFDLYLGILSIKEDLLDFWIPITLIGILIILFLRRRIKFLHIGRTESNGYIGYQFIIVISIFVPLIMAQNFIKLTSSELHKINSITEIKEVKSTDYFFINNYDIFKNHRGVYRTSRTGGRNNKDLTYYIYCVVPIIDQKESVDLSNHRYWYGIKFSEKVSNYQNDSMKNEKWKAFQKSSFAELNNYNFNSFLHLKGVSFNDDKDGYIEAIKSLGNGIIENELIIVEPVSEAYQDRIDDALFWFLCTLGISKLIILTMILIPSFDNQELLNYRNNQTLKKDDLNGIFEYLIPKRNHVITSVLININILVFILMVFYGINIISATPLELLKIGAIRRYEVLNGEHWRLLTSMFLHGGLIHILMNIFGIGFTCALVEPVIGKFRTLVAYIISGIGASVVSIYWHENTISVGASGAIFGMMGVMLALLLTKRDKGMGGIYLILVGLYGGISLLFGLLGGIDNAAHIGGLFSGILIGFLLIGFNRNEKRKLSKYKKEQRVQW